jgi:hypothetical protein
MQVITWLIVGAGWVIVHCATLSRERRRENREAVLKVTAYLQELEKDAAEFHTANGFDAYKCAALTQKTERVITTLQRAPFKDLNLDPNMFKSLRQSITRHNVDPSTFSQQAAYSEIMRDIRIATDDLIDAVEEAKSRVWK